MLLDGNIDRTLVNIELRTQEVLKKGWVAVWTHYKIVYNSRPLGTRVAPIS